jgi:hypothetical protein
VDFEITVLEGDRAKRVRAIGARFHWEEDNVGFINGPKVSSKRMEVIEAV